jgi:two-component system, cell cycle response regulator DivK
MSVRILHVEDNPANRMIVRDLLEFQGYEVVEAFDGEEALIAAARERPDLILMDIQLPRISGLEATRRIKARADLRDIPIVAVTSFALSGDDQKASTAGCDAYIAKPYRPRDLLQIVQKLLAAGSSRTTPLPKS